MGRAFYEQAGVAVTCRSLDEYVRMFSLAEDWMKRYPTVLDAAAGMSSFTVDARSSGIRAVAADPAYGMSMDEMQARGRSEMAEAAAKLERMAHLYDWSYYGSLEEHRSRRELSFERFLRDYGANAEHGAYVRAALPQLPFADGAFSLVLCSHFLFLYREQFSFDFHRAAVLEMLRVTKPGGEIRIYPLVDFQSRQDPQTDTLFAELAAAGGQVELIPSGLPFIPGSSRLLRVVRA